MTYGGVRSGDLNRRITIQQRAINQDTFGQQIVTWVDLLSCWAEISPTTGRELVSAEAQQAVITHTVTIRYRPSILAAMRVVYQNRILDIHAVMDPDTQHRKLTLLCSEGLTAG